MLSVIVTVESKKSLSLDVKPLCFCTVFQYKTFRIGEGSRGDNNDSTLHHNLEKPISNLFWYWMYLTGQCYCMYILPPGIIAIFWVRG